MHNGALGCALVTGFEPFGGDAINPSAGIARALDGRRVAGRRIVGRILPVDTALAVAALRKAIADAGPLEAIVCTGLAAGRTALALERTAVNVLDFEIADNAGALVRSRPIAEDGEAARFTKLPLDRILASWRAAGIPGFVSDSAGTYLCNQVFYEVLALNDPSVPAGFIHVPATPELAIARGAAKTPSLPLDLMVRGVECALVTVLTAAPAGATR